MSLEFEIPMFSLLFIIIIFIVYFSKSKLNLMENKCYYVILIASFIEILLDTIIHFICAFNDFSIVVSKYYVLLNDLNKVLSILFVVIFSALFCYIMLISYKKIKEKPFYLFIPIIIINLSFSIVMLFTNIELVKKGYVTNVIGETATYGYVVVAILLMLSLLITLLNIKKLDRRYFAIFYIIVIMGILYVITLIFPGIIIYDLILVLLCYIMYFTIENPDVKMIEQLEQSQLAAEKANRAKSEFLSSMSHEIRTPLNAIVGFSEMIKDEKNMEACKEDAKDIVIASQTLLEIVNGILDISKIEANKMEIVNTNYELLPNLENIAKLMIPRIGEKPIELNTNFAPDIPSLMYGDLGKIKQIVTNLLTNAVKYTEKGKINFNVSCINQYDTCSLVISVSDTGRGIKSEKINSLFTKFNRLEEDRNTTIEGTGLGLAITKSLIEMMGGKIIVQSKYGQGSKFIVYLNQKIVKEHDEIKVKEETSENYDFKGAKVLVADDNILNLKVADKLLKKFNIDTKLVESGMECLDLINNGNKFDLILLDDMMPRMRGIETLMRLKQINGFNIPTICLTANAIAGQKESYIKQGFNDYLAKPIEHLELIKILNKYLKPNIETIENVDLDDNSVSDTLNNKVLIVDDNAINIKIASNFLKPYNKDIEGVLSGEECLNKVKNNDYDLILMDDMMPTMSGVETLHKLKEDNNFKTPVVALTANAIPGARENYLKEGFNEYISKPIDKTVLDNVMKKVTDIKDNNISGIDYLKNNNIDIDNSLKLLGDIDMYNETMNDFLNAINDHLTKLNNYKNDLANYAIEAHSIKSDAKYLGFINLASIAYDHEIKAKENNINYINTNYESFVKEINNIINICNTYKTLK